MMIESERILIFQWHYQMNQKAFYMFYIFFYNTLYTIPKNSRKDMFDSDWLVPMTNIILNLTR